MFEEGDIVEDGRALWSNSDPLYELIVGVTGSMDCFCVEQEQDAVRRPTNDIRRQSARLMVKQLHEHAMLSRRDTQAWPHET